MNTHDQVEHVQAELALDTPPQPKLSSDEQLLMHLCQGDKEKADRLRHTPLFQVALHGNEVVWAAPIKGAPANAPAPTEAPKPVDKKSIMDLAYSDTRKCWFPIIGPNMPKPTHKLVPYESSDAGHVVAWDGMWGAWRVTSNPDLVDAHRVIPVH